MVALLLIAGSLRTPSLSRRDPDPARVDAAHHVPAAIAERRAGASELAPEPQAPHLLAPGALAPPPPRPWARVATGAALAGLPRTVLVTRSARAPPVG